jgi:hypothetical protein
LKQVTSATKASLAIVVFSMFGEPQ